MSATCIAIYGFVALTNLVSFFAVRKDKSIAQSRAARRAGQSRIPEMGFLALALFGGWVLGIVAMMTFRHKTAKPGFLAKYVVAAALGTAALWGWLGMLDCL